MNGCKIEEQKKSVKKGRLVAIKTDNKTAHDPKPLLLNKAYAIQRVSAEILKFLRLLQRLRRGRFYPNEHTREICLDHRFQQFRSRSKIDGSLGGEPERIPVVELAPVQLPH